MASTLASMLRRAAAQPKPPAYGYRKPKVRCSMLYWPRGVVDQKGCLIYSEAIATNLRRNLARGSARPQDNIPYGEAIRPKGSKTFKDAWLTDKGAWPVLGVIGFAVVFCSGFLVRTTFFHPDVRIDRKSRATTIRSSGIEKDD